MPLKFNEGIKMPMPEPPPEGGVITSKNLIFGFIVIVIAMAFVYLFTVYFERYVERKEKEIEEELKELEDEGDVF